MKKEISGKQYLHRKLTRKYGVMRGNEIYKEIGLSKKYKISRKRAKEIYDEHI